MDMRVINKNRLLEQMGATPDQTPETKQMRLLLPCNVKWSSQEYVTLPPTVYLVTWVLTFAGLSIRGHVLAEVQS